MLVSAVAERVALAVENARLFEQTQRALAETERLYETARTISSAPDLEAVYRLVTEQISTISNVDNIEILMSGPDPLPGSTPRNSLHMAAADFGFTAVCARATAHPALVVYRI